MTSKKTSGGELGVVLPFPSVRRQKEAGGEWILAALPLPMKIASEPDVDPVGLFFVEVASGLVSVGGIVGEDLEESVFSAWRSFSAELAEKGRPTPAKVRTEDEASAEALRRVVGEEVEVTSGPTPEAAELEASLRGRGVPASYFHGQSLDTALIREFFTAAAEFRRAKPWDLLGSGEPLYIDIPVLDVIDGALCIIRDGGEGGLQIVYSLADLFHLYDVGEGDPQDDGGEIEAAQDAVVSNSRTVMFYRRRELPDTLRRDLPRLSFAPKSGPLPALVACDPMGNTRALTDLDYRVARVALEAVTRYINDNRSALADDLDPEDAEYTVRSQGEEIEVFTGLCEAADLDGTSSLGALEGEGERPSFGSVHRLKLRLVGAKPPIWRRLEVPSEITFGELHEVIQAAMGWQDEHLHCFNHHGRVIAPAYEEHEAYDEDETELWAVLPAVGEMMRYTYDYGDNWIHELVVEDVRVSAEEPRPRCIDGRRAGPPEDCGGVPGLDMLLKRGSSRRAGDEPHFDYNPRLFSVESVNVRLGWTADEAAEAERRANAEIEAAKGAGKGSAKAPSGAEEGSDSSRQAPLFDDL